ncbi:MAG TPA: GFA family protein [Bradyrhizobium sp.]|nr:GFA family protein [Bradyrhizobium sp.]
MRSARPVLPLTGGCSCGAIRYSIASFPLLLYTCNCTDCQTASGSAFALNMPVLTKDFDILQGQPKGWRHLSPGGADVTSWFCGDCGGRIYGERAERSETVNIRAGTLDDTKWLVPAAHMFMRSAQPWVLPAANAECHEVGPEDFRPLGEKWRAMWSEFSPRE